MGKQSTFHIFLLSDKGGVSRYTCALCVLFIIAIFIAFHIISNLPAIQKKFPGKDPYKLEELAKRRQQLNSFTNISLGNSKSDITRAESAFLQGEIHEAEYFLSKADKNSREYKSLKSKINSYKTLRGDLENWLYVERNFQNEPFTYGEAYKIINNILKLSDTGYIHVRNLFLKGYLLLKEGRRTEARRVFQDLSKNGGVLAETSGYLLAKTYMPDDDKSKSIGLFNQFIDRNQNSRLAPLACYYLSSMLHETGKNKEALESADRGIKIGENSEYLQELLIAQEAALDVTSSEFAGSALSSLLKRFPLDNEVFKRAIQVYEDWDKGLMQIDKSDVLLETCNVLVVNGRFHQSKKLIDKLIPTLEKNNLAYARLILAKRQKGVGELDSSLKECKSAIALTDDKELKTSIYALMGEVYGLKKDVASAEKYYSLAGKAKGSMSDWALREIARIAYENGWRKKAEKYYSELAESFPDSQYASEGLNYLVVLSHYNKDKAKTEKYARLLKENGTLYEDRLKGDYYLNKIGKGRLKYCEEYPLAYYSFIAKKCPVDMHIEPSRAYPAVNQNKSNLAWEYFLAGCYDLAEKEYEFLNNQNDPYGRMVLCHLAFINKGPHDGILKTRDFTAGNFQAQLEKGYSDWFFQSAFPMKYRDEIEKLAIEYNFSISFILAIIRQESYFRKNAKSSAGALGLMQIMPSTGKWIAQYFKESRGFKKSKLTDPNTNLKYGVWYQKHLRDILGNEAGMILAGHNGGPGNVEKWKGMFPVWDKDKYLFYEMIPSMETRNFIRHVHVNQRIYEIMLKNESEKVYF
ncbi:transglycosylase SLT domain-containing protein [bacterium]|nr:transglycosylase SLT domain-containing protein [bacterium]